MYSLKNKNRITVPGLPMSRRRR